MNTKIKRLDPKTLEHVRFALNEALASVRTQFDLSVTVGRCVYDPSGNSCTWKLEFATKGEGGVVNDKEREDYKRIAELVRLKPEWLDQPVTVRGGLQYKVVGYALTRRRNPVLMERLDNGKRYWFDVDVVRQTYGVKDEVRS